MSDDVLTLARRNLRATDSNTLLRWYDLVKAIFNTSTRRQERVRADTAVRRLAKELQKRNVPL